MSERVKPMGMDRALSTKMGAKYDPSSEEEVRIWIRDILGEDIGTGCANVEKSLKNGVILVKLLQKIYEGTSNLPPAAQKFNLKYSELDTPFKQMENIEIFLKGCSCYGLKNNSLFQTGDLFEGRNMAMVLATILQVGTEAQRHGFNGPTAGPRPCESAKRHFTYEQLKSSHGTIGLQSGSNKFASQKGMKIGSVRHIADIRADDAAQEGQGIVTLQSGSNQHASQKGMTGFGAVRHIADIRADDLDRGASSEVPLQYGTNRHASQKGMTAFGAVRHISDIAVRDLAEEQFNN